jgi:hypothetical protein
MLSDFIPLLSVIIGGLLTVLGGIVTNYFTQSSSRKVEKRKVYREQLEQIYESSSQVMKWIEWHQILDNRSKDEDQAPPCPIDKVVMIARLYLPSLKTLAIDFAKIFNENKIDIITALRQDQGYIYKASYYSIEESYEKLLASIEGLAQKEVA